MVRSFFPHRFLLAAIISFCALIPASGLYAVENGGLGGRPAHPDPSDARTQSWFVLKADPGSTIQDEVAIANNSAKPKDVRIYPADSIAASGGGFALKQEGESMKGVGAWTTIATSSLHLAAGEKKSVRFTIIVPSSTTPGEHTGGIMIQENTAPMKTSDGMSLSVRMGVRIYLTVSGEVKTSLSLGALDTALNENAVNIRLPLVSTGNTSVNIVEGSVVLRAEQTQTIVQELPLSGFQVLQDSPFIFTSKFDRPTTPGAYSIDAHVAYLDQTGAKIELRATSTTITIPDPTPPPSTSTTARTTTQHPSENVPNLMLVCLVSVGAAGIVVGGAFGFPLGRRSRRGQAEVTPSDRPKKIRKPKKPVAP